MHKLHGMTEDNPAAAAIDGLVAANMAATVAVARLAEPEQRVQVATQVAEMLRTLADTWARTRAREVAELRRVRGLSLDQLAVHLGLSLTRAAQLVRAARRR